ncbi:MAG: hypothetical protein ACLT46_07295 [Hungatella sp.]
MDKDKEAKQNQERSEQMFNSITEKTSENQNQTHNSKRERLGPNIRRRSD